MQRKQAMSKTLFAIAVGILVVCAAVARAESESVAALLKDLVSGDESVRLRAIDLLGEQAAATPEVLGALGDQLKDHSAVVRAHAAHALGHLGPAARPVIAGLAPLIVDSDATVRRTAIRTWARIHPSPDVSIPLLENVLKDADPTVRGEVLEILAEIGKPAVPALIQALGQEKTVYWACLVLGEIGPDAADAASALADVLAVNGRPEVRREAALALGSIGPAAASATPTLSKALGDREVSVVAGAAYALGRIGPEAKPAVPALEKCADGADLLLRTISTWALAKIERGNEARRLDAVSLLAAALGSRQPQVRLAAARGLADLRPAPELVLPAIKNALENRDMAVATTAVEALASLGEPALPALIDALKIERIRPAVARILGGMGPQAKKAVPALAEIVVRDGRIPARCEALMALGAIGPDAAESVSAVVEALRGTREDVCYAACYALGRMGPSAIAAEAELRKKLADPNESITLSAAWALARIDPTSAEIARQSVPLLIKGLADSEPRVRTEAAVSLGRLGPLAKDAAPALKTALHDTDEMARDAAEKALKATGG
jgi:HEAT repeat protein